MIAPSKNFHHTYICWHIAIQFLLNQHVTFTNTFNETSGMKVGVLSLFHKVKYYMLRSQLNDHLVIVHFKPNHLHANSHY